MTSLTELRRTGIGGTDAPAIAGLNPYVSAHDIYLDKLGLRDIEENEAMYLGRFFEDRICELYEDREHVTLIKPELVPFRHPQHDWMIGSPDRLAPQISLGVDAKMAGLRQMWRWGLEGTDRVPDEYHAQAQWYLALTGYERWDIAVLLGQSFKVYRITPHADLQAALISLCERFWRDHIGKHVPPAVDHTENARKMLQALYPKAEDPLRPATDEEAELAFGLRETDRNIEALERRRHYFLNRLRETIALADGIAGNGFRITWRRHKDQRVTDWEKAFEELVPYVDTDRWALAIERFTTIKSGQRVLRTHFKEAEDD